MCHLLELDFRGFDKALRLDLVEVAFLLGDGYHGGRLVAQLPSHQAHAQGLTSVQYRPTPRA